VKPDKIFHCLFDEINIHVFGSNEKILVLSIYAGESGIELRWNISVSENSNIIRQTVVEPHAVVSIRQISHH
jgi:hypothetical protein